MRPGIQPCPGLRAGIFTDSRGQRHDLALEPMLTPKEAAADPRLGLSVRETLQLMRTRRLYPVWRKNARVIRTYPCALADYCARRVTRIARTT